MGNWRYLCILYLKYKFQRGMFLPQAMTWKHKIAVMTDHVKDSSKSRHDNRANDPVVSLDISQIRDVLLVYIYAYIFKTYESPGNSDIPWYPVKTQLWRMTFHVPIVGYMMVPSKGIHAMNSLRTCLLPLWLSAKTLEMRMATMWRFTGGMRKLQATNLDVPSD